MSLLLCHVNEYLVTSFLLEMELQTLCIYSLVRQAGVQKAKALFPRLLLQFSQHVAALSCMSSSPQQWEAQRHGIGMVMPKATSSALSGCA